MLENKMVKQVLLEIKKIRNEAESNQMDVVKRNFKPEINGIVKALKNKLNESEEDNKEKFEMKEGEELPLEMEVENLVKELEDENIDDPNSEIVLDETIDKEEIKETETETETEVVEEEGEKELNLDGMDDDLTLEIEDKELEEALEDQDQLKEDNGEENKDVDMELVKENRQFRNALKQVHISLTESNLVNLKSKAINMLFNKGNFTKGQKNKIVEAFDAAMTTKQVSYVFESVKQHINKPIKSKAKSSLGENRKNITSIANQLNGNKHNEKISFMNEEFKRIYNNGKGVENK